MNFLAKLPYYAFVGFVGVVALITAVIAPFYDIAPGVGWCILAAATLFYYLGTIEAPVVECEWAGWILMVGSTLTVLAGVSPVNVMVWVLSPLIIAFAIAMHYSPEFREKVNQRLFPKGKPSPKVSNANIMEESIATAEVSSSDRAA